MPISMPSYDASLTYKATNEKIWDSHGSKYIKFVEVKPNKTGNLKVDSCTNTILSNFRQPSIQEEINLNIEGVTIPSNRINLLNKNEINTFLEKKINLSRVIGKVKDKIIEVYDETNRLAQINLELTEDPEFNGVYTLYLTVSNKSDDIDVILDDFERLMPYISYGDISDEMGDIIVVGVI